ncbi:hypothetical protein [Cyclobacterium roseum]|uniref:hypothetical protein n=1 Tax=Cyclobacterium roseum TaxID=2666137 RepID=UPI001391AF7E|nr:hypothetical protein [Cyclobacterium roseum]
MNKQYKNIDFQKIDNMVEGDIDFRKQLLEAIEVALIELENSYLIGIKEKSLPVIKQARHKIKPTLGLFDLERLAVVLGNGKRFMQDHGFGDGIEGHKKEFQEAVHAVLEEVKRYR